ncbi:MAG: hypothetical protein WBG90_00675 [Saonia sp.]
MKTKSELDLIFFVFLTVFCGVIGFQNIAAQNVKKNRVRLKADYVKIMDNEVFLKIKASSKIENRNMDVPHIDLTVYNEFDGEEIELGNTTTNRKGESKFVLSNLDKMEPDTTNTYTIVVSFEGNESYKRASRSVSFKNADIKAKLITKDSINYVTATLMDTGSDSLVVGESLNVQVQRLFGPLKIGEEFNNTDENGTILVPVEEGIPGIDGNLTIEVVLNDHDEYGTVKALIDAPIGTPIVEESTFDQRTMWSPRNKTPLFMLVFTNLLIFGIWGFIAYLITNLFRIAKS